MSETNNKIKEELFSLFKEIKDDIPNDQLPLNNKSIQNISTLDSITLITYIKESLPLLISHKISEAITQNNNNNELSAEFDDNNNLRKDYSQLENQIRKIESDNRYYVQLYLKCEIQKKVLDMKLNAYQYLEDEYEHLKEKVKYISTPFPGTGNNSVCPPYCIIIFFLIIQKVKRKFANNLVFIAEH